MNREKDPLRKLKDISQTERIPYEADLKEKLIRQISNKLNTRESILKKIAPNFGIESPSPYFQGQRDAEVIFELPIECRGMVFSPERYSSLLEQSLYYKGFLSNVCFSEKNKGDFDRVHLLLALRKKYGEEVILPFEAGLRDASYSSGFFPERFSLLKDKIAYICGYVKRILLKS
ncbi:MAG: hypothetical protein QXX68_00570 [Candidatus Pacearchaeota archaeon]